MVRIVCVEPGVPVVVQGVGRGRRSDGRRKGIRERPTADHQRHDLSEGAAAEAVGEELDEADGLCGEAATPVTKRRSDASAGAAIHRGSSVLHATAVADWRSAGGGHRRAEEPCGGQTVGELPAKERVERNYPARGALEGGVRRDLRHRIGGEADQADLKPCGDARVET